VLKQKKIKNGGDVSFYLPETEGTENISDLPDAGGVKKRRTRKKSKK
jgi:hypothetical protein